MNITPFYNLKWQCTLRILKIRQIFHEYWFDMRVGPFWNQAWVRSITPAPKYSKNFAKKIKNFKKPYPTCQFQIIQIILIMFSEIYSIGRNEEESCGSFLVPTLMDSNPDLENRKQSKIQFGIVVEDTEDHLIRSFSNLILIQITLLENTTGLSTKDRIYTVCYPLQITSSPLIKVNLTTMKHKVWPLQPCCTGKSYP